MEELQLLTNLALITATALGGGLAAQRLRQPALLGYLLGGILVGPYGLRLIPDPDEIQAVATIGIAFLMFSLGVELSLRTLLRSGKVVLLSGGMQLSTTIALWSLVANRLGWPALDGLLFGYLIALASTAIVLKLLLDRGELDSVHGRILIGIMLLQDLTLIPIMVIVASVPTDLVTLSLSQLVLVGAAALAKGLGVVAGMVILGLIVVPRLLNQVARLRSRELFMLAVFSLVIGTASFSVLLGLSAALGAFIAGLVVSDTEYSHQALADVIPLRDIFASFFFVSIGMLTNPGFVVENVGLLALILMVLLIAKCAVPALTLLALRYPLRPALAVGGSMLPMGEFSFVLVGASMAAGLASERLVSLTLATAIVTMFLAPAAVSLARDLTRRLGLLHLRWPVQEEASAEELALPETRHAIICGFGRTGRGIATLLTRRHFPCVVIDLDPAAIEEARARQIPHIYGDASSITVLQRCNLDRARVLVVAISDPAATDITLRNALALNPRLDVVARVYRQTEVHTLHQLENVELVEPGFEAGLEIIRHTLHRFGLSSQEIQILLTSIRQGSTQI